MRSLHVGTLCLLVLVTAMPAAAAAPAGWLLAGSDPSSYQIERDAGVAHGGKASGRLASTAASAGFGTMMQSFDAGEYRGKRLRLSTWVKSRDVKRWAGVWMRVDGANHQTLAFDNMQDRAIKATKDWTRCDIVLDVADAATGIFFGILLDGEGTVWLNDVQFQVVDHSVPTTSSIPATQPKQPTNLDFGS